MDGVLADTEALQARAWVILVARYGGRVDERYFDRWIGIPDVETARDIAGRFGIPGTVEQIIGERRALYLDLVGRELRPFPGLAESLASLRLPAAVATSSSRADVDLVLARLGLARRFAAVVAVEDVARTKPDPEIYAKAASRLGLAAADCAAIEDSPTGVASARSAGCYVVAVTTTHGAGSLAAAHEIRPDTVTAIASIVARAG